MTASDGIFCVAETTSGKIQGLVNAGIKQFRGVPYGASTGGANRFMPPEKPVTPNRFTLATWLVSSRSRLRRFSSPVSGSWSAMYWSWVSY